MGSLSRVLGLCCVGLSVLAAAQYDTGTAIGFGNSNFYQTAQSNAPFVDLIVGPHHALLERTDGSVVAWGSTPHGVNDITPIQAEATLGSVYRRGLGGLAAGNGFTVGVSPFPSNFASFPIAAAWGLNTRGQCSLPTLDYPTKVAAGDSFAVCIQKLPRPMVGWGSNSSGQLSFGTVTDAVGVAAGAYHTVILHSNGTVTCFGDNSSGQSTVPGGLTGVTQVAAGHNHTLALLSNGTVVGWGNNSYGELSLPTNGVPFVQIAASDYYSVGLRADGTVVCSGWNDAGQCVVPFGLTNVVKIGAGYKHALALKNDGTVVGWGLDTYGDASPPPVGLSNATKILPGLALMGDGSVKTWGPNTASFAAQLAALPAVQDIAGTANEAAVVQTDGLMQSWPSFVWSPETTVAHADVSQVHVISVHSDTTVTASGPNIDGVCNVPAGLTGVKQVQTAYTVYSHAYSIALMLDGTVQGWGWNGEGQLNFPAGLSNVTQISARGDSILALKNDGTVTGWGGSFFGQTNIPLGLSNVVQVAAGENGVLALKGDGTIVPWGTFGGLPVAIPPPAVGVTSIANRGGSMIATRGLSLTNDEQAGTGLHDVVNYTLHLPQPATADTVVQVRVFTYQFFDQFNVTIPAGSSSASFAADCDFGNPWVEASLNGATVFSTVDKDLGFAPTALSTFASTVVGGNSTTAAISVNFNGSAGGGYVWLDSSPNVSVPHLLYFPGPATTMNIPVYTNPVSANYAGWIRATGASNGTGVVMTKTLNLLPTTLMAPAMYPAHLVGGASSKVVIQLSRPAPLSGLEMALSTDQPSVLSFPARVIVPAGAQTATIFVHTTAAAGDVVASLMAAFAGQNVSSTLTVYRQWEKSLTFYKTRIPGGTGTTGIVTLSQGAPAGGMTVSLSSSDPSLVVPASVTIPVGGTTVTFPVTTSVVAANTPVTITASDSSGGLSSSITVLH